MSLVDFSLTDEEIQLLRDGFDSLLDFFGQSCKLIYQPRIVNCPACVNLASNQSNTHWRHGGPLRIDQQGICGVCGGTNKKTEEVSEIIKMSLAWQPKDFIGGYFQKVAPGVNAPRGIIQSRAYLTDLPKINKCIEMHAQLPIENYIGNRYKLLREGQDQFGIIKGRYFLCFWERI